MTDSHVDIPGTSDKLQTYKNNKGGVDVHSEAVTPTNTAGNAMATNAGAVDDTVPRVTLASNDPSVTLLNSILSAITALSIVAAPTVMQKDFNIPANVQVPASRIDTNGFRIILNTNSRLVMI